MTEYFKSLLLMLDSRTILISTTLMAIFMGFVILSQRKMLPKGEDSSVLVSFSLFSIGLGSLFLGFRGVAPLWLSLIVGNVLLELGVSFLLVGLRRFDNLYAPLWWVAVCPSILLLSFFITDSYGIQVFMINLLLMILSGAIVWSLLSSETLTNNRLLVLLVIGLSCIFAAIRMYNGLVNLMKENPISLITGSSTSQILLSINLITVLLWAMGFFLMKNDKVRSNLIRLSTHDQMTQALTRSTFMVLAEDLYKESKSKGTCGSVLMLDLDNFKKINDTYGHQMGDAVLIMFAKNIIKNIRSTDIFARYGGEEFIVFLPETDKKNAVKIAESIRKITSDNSLVTETGNYPITVSIGVSSSCNSDVKLDVLINSADKALYKAKNTGRNKVCEDNLLELTN